MARFSLIKDALGYGLKDNQSNQKILRIDFTSNALQHRLKHGGKKELLLKAINARPGLVVWDCTAGLGVDSLLMAAQGCFVTMFERSPVIATLLKDALLQAKQAATSTSLNKASIATTVATHMKLRQQDALLALNNPGRLADTTAVEADHLLQADVIYIDPMFPQRKKSARVKAGMQLLQHFLGTDEDAERLLLAAIASGCPRVVVKRPAQNGTLIRQPDISFAAKSNRFDVFLNPDCS